MRDFNKILLLSCLALVVVCCTPGDKSEQQAQPIEQDRSTADDSLESRTVVLFFGNSLTAAYGLDPSEGFTGLIQSRVDSLNWPVEVVNAGVTGETTATGENRVDWVVKRQQVDVFVLELGANDGLRGIPVSETEQNLRSIVAVVRKYHPQADIILAGMMVPPNMGQDYSDQFRQVFPRVAKSEGIHLIPFLLDGVAGEETLNLEDGIHPNPDGHRIVTENIWNVLEPILSDRGVDKN